MSEKEIQKQCIEYLKKRNIFFYRQNQGRMGRIKFTSINGVPDIVAVIKGKYVGIELKDEKGKQSEDQKTFQKNLEQAGGEYWLIRDLDELIKKL